jgi:Cytochrome P460
MKKGILLAAALLFGLAALASAQMPGPDPAALWNYFTKENPYIQWGFWPDHQGLQPGRAPHGPLHKVYVNDRALKSRRLPLPDGALEVKESYSAEKKLVALSVMYKLKGYNPGDGGDWFWAEYTPDGKVGKFGKVAGCIGCHAIRSYNDFVQVHKFK